MAASEPDPLQSWNKFLNPDSLKSNLIVASMFLAAYESLRASVIDQLKDFFCVGFDQNGFNYSPDYESKVLSKHKSPLRASLLWLKDMDVVTGSDLDRVDRIRKHRNEIAHDLPRFITESDSDVNVPLIVDICEMVAKIDQWWIREVEIPTNPDFTPEQLDSIDYAGVTSGRMMFLRMMLEIATGDDEQASSYYNAFTKAASDMAQRSS